MNKRNLPLLLLFLLLEFQNSVAVAGDRSETPLWPKAPCSTVIWRAVHPDLTALTRTDAIENLQNRYSESQIELIRQGGESNIYRIVLPDGQSLAAKVPNAANEHAAHGYRNEFERFNGLSAKQQEGFIPLIEFDSEGPFLIMKHIHGLNLCNHLADYGPEADPLFILGSLKEIALSLKVLHDKGIAHADVKPSNIIVDPTEQKLLLGDLSFATEFGRKISYLDPGIIAGTHQYLPPDERNGCDIIRVHRDLYALKITTQALVLGEEPFSLPSQHLTNESAPLGDVKVLRFSPYTVLAGVSPVLSAISFSQASSIDEYLWLIERGMDAHRTGDYDRFFFETFGPLVLSKRPAKEVAELISVSRELKDRLAGWFTPQKLGLSRRFYKEVLKYYRKIDR